MVGSSSDRNLLTRRRLLAALLGGGTAAAALSPLDSVLGRITPTNGRLWKEAAGTRDRFPDTLESPHGPATVTFDDNHIPHVDAETEAAAYFAVGYVQAADRLFQMDVFRRKGRGTLSEVAGDLVLELDLAVSKLDFQGAIEASRQAVEGTRAEEMTQAYADGVNAFVERGSYGVEFGILDYEPDPWTVTSTLSVVMGLHQQQAFDPTAILEDVKRETFSEEEYETLYPEHFDHGAPILRDRDGGESSSVAAGSASGSRRIEPELAAEAAKLSGPDYAGSNAWTIAGEHTEHGEPLLCSDPHLPLNAPPFVYQQHVSIDETEITGVSFPGFPFFFVGEKDGSSWGITSAMADVTEFYSYEVDGDQYRYGDEWRSFDTTTKTLDVRGLTGRSSTREVEVKKTVHGPMMEREIGGETHSVGVAWVPLSGTRTLQGFYEFTTADDVDEFQDATQKIDAPPLNVHYVDDSGDTLYQLASKVPIRRVDGTVVRGDRVFDGSEVEAEWDGYEPYGQSSWDGFVPFEELPSASDADYVASANQRVVDDPQYPLGREAHPGFRAKRIYERLDEAIEAGTTIDREFVRSLQLDTLDLRAAELVPAILDARERMPERAEPWLDALADWDYRMERDSEAALLFAHVVDHFETETWSDVFEGRDLPNFLWPSEWVLVTLPADSEFFDGDRAAVLADAMERAVDEIEDEGWEVYGDYHRPAIDHTFQFGSIAPELNYPRYPVDGSDAAVRAQYGPTGGGATYRMVSDLGGDSLQILAGGNDGSPLSEHYADQLELWADGEYVPLGDWPSGGPDVTVQEAEE